MGASAVEAEEEEDEWDIAVALLRDAGDPMTAAKLARNDWYRLKRAYGILKVIAALLSSVMIVCDGMLHSGGCSCSSLWEAGRRGGEGRVVERHSSPRLSVAAGLPAPSALPAATQPVSHRAALLHHAGGRFASHHLLHLFIHPVTLSCLPPPAILPPCVSSRVNARPQVSRGRIFQSLHGSADSSSCTRERSSRENSNGENSSRRNSSRRGGRRSA